MWPDSARRANEIRSIAKTFENGGFTESSLMMETIAKDVESGVRVDKKFLKIKDSFFKEYAKEDPKIEEICNFILGRLLLAFTKNPTRFSAKFHELYPWLNSYKEKVHLMAEFTRHLLNQEDATEKLMFIFTMIAYGWIAEGLFDEAIRLIYIFVKLSYGENIYYQDVQETSLRTLRKELYIMTGSSSEVLFLGWENGNLRNSIFHFRFRYMESVNKFHFQDFHNGKQTYDECWNLEEFKKFYKLLNAIDELIMLDTLIMRIGDLIYSRRPYED